MRILIINLTRMGDIIQTLGLVNGLYEKYPDAEIDYLAMSSFKKILENFPRLSRVIAIDDRPVVEQINEDFRPAFLEIQRVANELSGRDYDIVVNPVVSIQSSILSVLIPAKEKLGMVMNRDREQSITSDWTACHLANEHNLGDRTFNLVDIFAGVGGARARQELFRLKPSDEAMSFAENLWPSGKPTVGFHIGASQSNKAWESEKFRRVIEMLLADRSCRIVLLGGYKEASLKPLFEGIRYENFIDMIGGCNLDQLTATIGRLDLLITNDTGPMHIAASRDIPILNLSLGPVSLWETGPYSDKSVIMQADIECHPCRFDTLCSHLNCHHFITPEAVYRTAKSMIERRSIDEQDNVLIWMGLKDIFGLQHQVPVNRRPIRKKEFFFECKRAVWAMTLLPDLKPDDWAGKAHAYLGQYYDIPPLDFRDEIGRLTSLHGMIQRYIGELESFSGISGRDKKSIDKIRNSWSAVKQLKQEIFDNARQYPGIFDIFHFAEFRESALTGDDMRKLLQRTLSIYRNLELQLAVMLRMINEHQGGPR